jgi:hypothetical protein
MPTPTPGKTQPSGSPDPGYRGRSKGETAAALSRRPYLLSAPTLSDHLYGIIMSLPLTICPSEATTFAEMPMWPSPLLLLSSLRDRLIDVIVQLRA